MVLSFLNSIGTDGSFGNQDSEDSILSHIGMSITPVFSPMGIREENWPATVGLITGIFAKEAVVGTLDSLYSVMDVNDLTEEEPFAFWDAVQEAFSTIPEKLDFLENVGVIEDISTAAAEQEVTHSTFGAMKGRFETVGAFGFSSCPGKSLLAWSVSVFYYGKTFAEHPQTSLFWLLSILL